MSKVIELVKLYRELLDQLGEDHQVPVEVIGPWVSTLFINEHGSNKPAPGARGETLEVTGELEAKGKPKQLDNGKTQYSIKVDGEYYNSLSIEVFKGRKFSVGDIVTVKYRQNGKYRNMVEVLPVDILEHESEDIPF